MCKQNDTIESNVGSPSKDSWDKWKIIINSFSVLLIPVILAIMTFILNSDLKNKEVQVKFVELSLNILSKPIDGSPKELRLWAAKILDKNSNVPLGDVRELLVNDQPLPASSKYYNVTEDPYQPVFITIKSNKELIVDFNITKIRTTNNVSSGSDEPHDYVFHNIRELPMGSFAHSGPSGSLIEEFKNYENLLMVSSDGWGGQFEIHKTKEGKIFLVGYSFIDEINKDNVYLYPGLAFIYSMKDYKKQIRAVAIPFNVINQISTVKYK